MPLPPKDKYFKKAHPPARDVVDLKKLIGKHRREVARAAGHVRTPAALADGGDERRDAGFPKKASSAYRFTYMGRVCHVEYTAEGYVQGRVEVPDPGVAPRIEAHVGPAAEYEDGSIGFTCDRLCDVLPNRYRHLAGAKVRTVDYAVTVLRHMVRQLCHLA